MTYATSAQPGLSGAAPPFTADALTAVCQFAATAIRDPAPKQNSGRSWNDNRWMALKIALDTLANAQIVCDATGEVLIVNRAAEAVFARGDAISIRRERLYVNDAGARAKLAAILTGTGLASERYRSTRSGALLVPRGSALPPYQVLLKHLDEEYGAASPAGTLWHVTVAEPAQASPSMLRAVAMLYELTTAEVRLARHVLSGLTLDEIARASGVKISTLRTQMSSLLRKSGARRQADLMRIVFGLQGVR